MPFDGGKRLQAKTLFKADDAVLHPERVLAQPEKEDDRSDRQHHQPRAIEVEMVDQVDDGDDQVCNQNRGEKKVKSEDRTWRDSSEPCGILTHARTRFPSGLDWLLRPAISPTFRS